MKLESLRMRFCVRRHLFASFLTLPFGHAYKGFEDKLMTDAFLRHRGQTAETSSRPDFSAGPTVRALRLGGWLILPAMLLLAVGCGGGSSKKQVADSGQAQEENKDAPAEEEAAPVVKKKVRIQVPAAPAVAEQPAPSKKDPTKWDMTDLNAALARKDLLFVPAVVMYSARNPTDEKRAAELDALVQRVAKLKDDPPPIPLAIPSSAVAAVGSPAPAAAAAVPAPAQPATEAPGTKLKYDFHIGRNRNK
jgi:hypothetical protein